MNKCRNETRDITTNLTKLKWILREYGKQLYANKLNKLCKMDKFLERHKLQKPSQEQRENLNRLITNEQIELVIKNLLTMTSSGTDGFQWWILANI